MDNLSIVKKLISGSALRVAVLVSNIVVAFFIMPFLIKSLGDRLYGFWTLIGLFIGYYGFLDLGLSSAVARFVSRAYGQKDYIKINEVINNSVTLFSCMGFVAIIFSTLTAFLSPFFIDNIADARVFKIVILIMGAGLSLGFPARAFIGALTSKLRYDLISYLDLIKLALRTLLVIYVIKEGHGLISLALVTVFIDVSVNILQFFAVSHVYQIKIRLVVFRWEDVKDLFNYSKYTFLTQIADTLRFKVDSLVIAGFLNTSLVTHYFIGSRLIEYFSQLIVSMLGILSPVFSQFEGKGDFESIRKWFLKATKISVILSSYIGSSLILYGDVFIERWMGPEYKDGYYVLVILCISTIFALMQNPSISLLYGISKHKYFAIASILEGVLNLMISISLVRFYGIYGVAMGTMISMGIFKLIVQPIYICRVIEIPFFEYSVKIILLNAIKTIVPILFYFYIVKEFLMLSYIRIFSLATIQLVIFIPIIFSFLLSAEERQYIKLKLPFLKSKK